MPDHPGKVIANITISADGYVAGPNQTAAALHQARTAAGDGNVAILGGAATINQYLAAGRLDELRLHVVPLILGAGARLFEGVPQFRLEQVKSHAANEVTHLTYRVQT